jgi:hypothetical protein
LRPSFPGKAVRVSIDRVDNHRQHMDWEFEQWRWCIVSLKYNVAEIGDYLQFNEVFVESLHLYWNNRG